MTRVIAFLSAWELGFRQARNETVDATLAGIERLRVTK